MVTWKELAEAEPDVSIPPAFGGVKGVLATLVASRRPLTPPPARGARHLSPES
jgi:hypothetical protein